MPFFRKKPVEIEARQLPDYNDDVSIIDYLNTCLDIAEWSGGESHMMLAEDEVQEGAPVGGPHMVISTLEGPMIARSGDWIIKGVQDEFYPCKPDIFDATYERV